MEFRLVYAGRLPAASQSDTRRADKNRIRRELAKQLRELWVTHPRLRDRMTNTVEWEPSQYGTNPDPSRQWTFAERRSRRFCRGGRYFCPLIANDSGGACGLDILFLRRDHPGNIIRSGGDVDNRIKVLFDALRMPATDDEIDGNLESDDDPFFCLLEDDRLITDVRVTTDRLLMPQQEMSRLVT